MFYLKKYFHLENVPSPFDNNKKMLPQNTIIVHNKATTYHDNP